MKMSVTQKLTSEKKTASTRQTLTKSSRCSISTATAKWKSSSARDITKAKRQRFIVAIQRRSRSYSPSDAAHETASLVDVVEPGEFPTAFGQFKNESNR